MTGSCTGGILIKLLAVFGDARVAHLIRHKFRETVSVDNLFDDGRITAGRERLSPLRQKEYPFRVVALVLFDDFPLPVAEEYLPFFALISGFVLFGCVKPYPLSKRFVD